MKRSFNHGFHTTWRRSKPTLQHLLTKFEKYLKPGPPRLKDALYDEALRLTKRDFQIKKQFPYHVNDVIRRYKHPDRSPGLPYTLQGYKRKDEVDPNKIKAAVHFMKYGSWSKCRTPCTAAPKSIVSPDGDKVRLIWVYPAHMTFAEGMFAMPLIDWYKENTMGRYGIWISYLKSHVRLLQSKKPPGWEWFAADYSSFDANVPAWMIRDAFDILRDNLDFSCYQERGAPTDPHTLPRLWKVVVDYFINTPIRFSNGLIRKKSKGVPSGSYFTNLVDSIVNCITTHYLLLLMNVQYSHTAFWVFGDDVLLASKRRLEVKTFQELALRLFGMELNMKKTEQGKEVTFLGFRLALSGKPIPDEERLWAQLLLPSRPDHSLDEFCTRIRALQLASFGGCKPFLYRTQMFLEEHDRVNPPPFDNQRDELYTKLEYLGLDPWTPLWKVLSV